MRNNGVEKKTKKTKNKTKQKQKKNETNKIHTHRPNFQYLTMYNPFSKSLRIQNKLGQELGVRCGSKSNAQFGGQALLNLNQTMTTISHNSHL